MKIGLVEEMVQNPNYFTEEMKDWRVYRIEYRGCPSIEEKIVLPPFVDADEIEDFLNYTSGIMPENHVHTVNYQGVDYKDEKIK